MNQELLNKYIAGDATPEEKEEVARWLDTDKKNMKEFLALRKLYDISTVSYTHLTLPTT